jgi:mono/diheme cytochrome c family protein
MLTRIAAAVLAALVVGKAAAQAQAANAQGDPVAGRALFVGATPFAKGGPPCGACHGVGGQGFGVAASYGPDLSLTHETYGAEALDSMLVDLPFPSMEPVYAGKALTPGERADVGAFLAAAGGKAPAKESGWFPLHAGGVLVVLLAALVLAGRRRTGSARAQLLERSRKAVSR